MLPDFHSLLLLIDHASALFYLLTSRLSDEHLAVRCDVQCGERNLGSDR